MTCRKLPAIKRASYVREIAQGIRKNKDFLARMISEEQDKVRPLAEVEVNFTADHTSIVQGDLEPN
jgi:lactaldehyde dehydrogenase/glycolaldehyde dehydrogenase